MSDLVMVVRHGEKGTPEGPVFGIDRSGSADLDSLSVRGWERAGALVAFFAWPHADGIVTPRHLYAVRPTVENPSKRPAQTLEALAARLGLTTSLAFQKEQHDELWREVQKADGPVLIAWEHKAIVPLANLIVGASNKTPQAWPDGRFDVVWRFERPPGGGAWRFSQVAQCLLANDSPSVIAG